MELSTLQDLMIEELKDLYDAEKQLLKALPKMAKAATNADLRKGFEDHLEQTKQHVTRLEDAFRLLEEKPTAKKCKAMEGLVAEGADLIGQDADPEVKDAALIGAAQKVEHYEIAGYGTVRAYAELLGLTEVEELLSLTLDEERETDESLTELAVGVINLQAVEDDSEDEDEDEDEDEGKATAGSGAGKSGSAKTAKAAAGGKSATRKR